MHRMSKGAFQGEEFFLNQAYNSVSLKEMKTPAHAAHQQGSIAGRSMDLKENEQHVWKSLPHMPYLFHQRHHLQIMWK
jgi:hypothetical protein